jgi:hypothetical protein
MKMIISLLMTFALGLPSHSATMRKETVKLASEEENPHYRQGNSASDV